MNPYENPAQIAMLTEKYHLSNNGNNVQFSYHDFTGKIIDFSDFKNLLLLMPYRKRRIEIDTKIKVIKVLIDSNLEEKLISDHIISELHEIIKISCDIFNNMLLDGWQESLTKSKYIHSLSNPELVGIFIDFFECIDYGIYCGLSLMEKRALENTDDPDSNVSSELRTVKNLINIEVIRKIVDELQNDKEEEECDNNIDLSKIKTIGSA